MYNLDSDLETSEFPFMAALGIVRCSDRLPATFTDPTGQAFWRCADWLVKRKHWSCYLETKAYLNNQPDRATAHLAARTYIPGRSDQWHKAETSWSNSIVNNSIVHNTLPPGAIVIVLPDKLFKICGPKSKRHGKLPAATVTTLNRLKHADIWWLKTSDLQGYMRARDIAEAWHAQHAAQPWVLQPTVNIYCNTADHLADEIASLRDLGYKLKRNTRTETTATMCLEAL